MAMDSLVVNVSWEFVLGLIGSLIALAYYASGRFTAIETDIGWLKDTIAELAINAENISAKLFRNASPISLTASGYHVLQRSGLKSYIDSKRATLLWALNTRRLYEPYELQRQSFHLLADMTFEENVGQHLRNFAVSNGISMAMLRRVGAIYLNDIATGLN
jgi:hypothetical protein